MFVRYVDKQGQTCTKFVDIVPLKSATADGVCMAITIGLETVDIDDENLKNKLVGCNFDAVQIQKKVLQPVVILVLLTTLSLVFMMLLNPFPIFSSFDETVRQGLNFYYYSPRKRSQCSIRNP